VLGERPDAADREGGHQIEILSPPSRDAWNTLDRLAASA
jgi:hypothetical protein